MLVQIDARSRPARRRPEDEPPPYAGELASELRRRVDGEVRFDAGSRALYSTDASNYRQPPIGVVLPRHAGDIERTLDLCRRYDAPVFGRGGGTSLGGQCTNVGVVLDFSKYMSRILEIDVEGRRARVEPGVVLDDLRHAVDKDGLTFGPDPATHDRCTFGGMIGNNSCGVHSQIAGRTDENVEGLEAITYDGVRVSAGPTAPHALERLCGESGRRGEIYRGLRAIRDHYDDDIRHSFPRLPRRVSGYFLPALLPEQKFDLARALVGSESTCAITLEATVRLIPNPHRRTLVVLGYPNVFEAADDVVEIGTFDPVALEGMDDRLLDNMQRKDLHTEFFRLLPEGKGWLLVEFGGFTKEEADERAERLLERLGKRPNPPSHRLLADAEDQEKVWEVRESGLGATAFVPGRADAWPGWEDSAVQPEKFGAYLRDLQKLYEKYGFDNSMYGHFGQGLVHTRISFDLVSEPGIQTFRSFMGEAAETVARYGGSLSGEHGDGQARGEFLPKIFSPELMQAMRKFRRTWDPDGKMNPGKGVDAHPVEENLRLGADYAPPEEPTQFAYPADNGSFPRAALRCVGVGKCRRKEGGTMCPSYKVTLEEQHSTRGRARLLFEMIEGEVLEDRWRSEAVHEALDLCLSCKGCKSDCPVNVDMATYKAEFLDKYYRGRLRPRPAYSMGMIDVWAQLASHVPHVANFFTQTPGLAAASKAVAGLAQERELPRFAPQTFRDWFRRRRPRRVDGPEALLWPDTFNNYFHPDTAAAAVETLEDAGFRVRIPEPVLCCGRPLYDFGFLDRAKRLLSNVVTALAPDIRRGLPLVGLEPSCVAVFRDELQELFPNHEDAQRLTQQTRTLGEFLADVDYKPPKLGGRALVHGHCHQKAVVGMSGETKTLDRTGIDYQLLDSGCCGMAGSFGFEAEKYGVSQDVGELSLLPAVRRAPLDAAIVADGFSCRTQVEQATGRRAVHLAELLRLASKRSGDGQLPFYPEDRVARLVSGGPTAVEKGLLALGGAAFGLATAGLLKRMR